MENSGSGIFRFLKIQSDDPRVIRQSRLVQVLVGLIILGALRGILISLSDMTTGELSALDILVFSGQIGALLIFTGLTLYLLHRGRFLIALNLCFIILNLILYSLLISTEGAGPFHLLMLVSVFSIAALQSIRISAIYLVVIMAAVSYFYVFIQPNDVESAISFIQVSLLLTAPSWFFANDLRRSRDRAQELAQTLETTVNNLDKRANQLEQIAEVGR
ncbi:MAG: hypothetical protein GWO38_32625, partial [Phycisphaerae bacterium]|nr:hypothetical protein [Phycisphaerae bacterium]NIX32242.1 hypothetical protein [Phycisphaerae bacterium]